MGYEIIATEPLAGVLESKGFNHRRTTFDEAQEVLEARGTDHVISIPSRKTADAAHELGEHYKLRRAAVEYSIPVTTELENARMLVRSLAQTETFTMHAYSELP